MLIVFSHPPCACRLQGRYALVVRFPSSSTILSCFTSSTSLPCADHSGLCRDGSVHLYRVRLLSHRQAQVLKIGELNDFNVCTYNPVSKIELYRPAGELFPTNDLTIERPRLNPISNSPKLKVMQLKLDRTNRTKHKMIIIIRSLQRWG